jgi:hypothetical protein
LTQGRRVRPERFAMAAGGFILYSIIIVILAMLNSILKNIKNYKSRWILCII